MKKKKTEKAKYVKPEIKKHKVASVVSTSLFGCNYYMASYSPSDRSYYH